MRVLVRGTPLQEEVAVGPLDENMHCAVRKSAPVNLSTPLLADDAVVDIDDIE